jgi:hypothetical protein
MPVDPNNPVIKLCYEGMQAEAAGKPDEARDLFMQAWMARQDDFEACVAAHYVARHQENPADQLRWNQEALNRAGAVGDSHPEIRTFYPSLYLNMGWSYESLGDRVEASKFYELAAASVNELPEGPYREMVKGGIHAAQMRMNSSEE